MGSELCEATNELLTDMYLNNCNCNRMIGCGRIHQVGELYNFKLRL
jgi:hypothetical protein